jgi:hypothetical protein
MTVTAISGTLDIGVLNSKIIGAGINPYTYIASAIDGTGPGGIKPTGGLGQYNYIIPSGTNNGTLSSRSCSQFTGQHGFGLQIIGSNRIYSEGTIFKNCWGDGIYIGTAKSTNIKLCSVIADNNRRQGVSITWADTVTIRNSIFRNTNGTEPCAGIDIEPNPNPSPSNTNNVQIYDTLVQNNAKMGISIYNPSGTPTSTIFNRNNIIERCTIEQNDLHGGIIVQSPENHIVRNNIIRNNAGVGVMFDRNASGGSITDNTIYSNTSVAVYLTAGTTNNTVSNNKTNTGAAVVVSNSGSNNII